MLSKEEYDPVNIHLGVPTIETFYNRKLKVKKYPLNQTIKTLSLIFRNLEITNGRV